MRAIEMALQGVFVLEPKVFGDERGFFLESYNRRAFAAAVGVDPEFVQDNHSRSRRGVLRGLHFQIVQPQGKLVRVVSGEVLDVVVDVRRSSPSFGRSIAVRLSAASHRQLWVPPGYAHGFVVLSESADFLYKTTDYYAPQYERSVRWDDPALAIDWQIDFAPTLSPKDRDAPLLTEAEVYP